MSNTTIEPENIRTVYRELCTSYRTIDDFRTKLLSFLPLATGGLFFFITNPEKVGRVDVSVLHAIGFFGLAITFGLFCFELYGIRKCTCLIEVGRYLEQELGSIKGQFSERPPGVFGIINEPFAAGIIYPAVMATWTFIAMIKINDSCVFVIDSLCCPAIVFVVGVLFTWIFMYWLVKIEIPRVKNSIKFSEAMTVFEDTREITINDKEDGNRFLSIGRSAQNNILVVSYTGQSMFKPIFIKNSRPATAEEQGKYYDKLPSYDEMLPRYDFSEGKRGKHKDCKQNTNVVFLEEDVAKVFKNSELVNQALRKLLQS